jgi:DNA-binding NarL/FixJ family response regulator
MQPLKTGQPPGEAHPSAKLTEAEVRAIRRRTAAGERQKDLAAEFHVSPSSISKIANGKSWAHLGPTPGPLKARGSDRPASKLTEGDIAPICQAIRRGLGVRAVARHYGVSPATISKIWSGLTWTHVPRPGSPSESPPRKRVWER